MGGVIIKIELENGSSIEAMKSDNKPIRGRRAKLYDLLNFQYGHDLTEYEQKVIESFTVKNPPSFDKEYDCIRCSLKKENSL